MNDRQEGDVWTIDPDATLQSLLDDSACPGLLRRALTGIPSWQVRSETIVGKTLRASSLMPQWLAALLALGAVVTVQREENPQPRPERAPARRSESAEGSVERDLPLEAFLNGKVKGEVTGLHIPTGGSSAIRWGEEHVARTPADEPIVAAFATVKMKAGLVTEARLALTGVWPQPVRLAEASGRLVGGPLSQDRITAVATAVEEAVEPQGDYRGSAAYRRAMAGVVARRALEACAAALTAGGR